MLLVLALCASTYLFGQSLTLGAIRGTVLDPSGAAVPGATVTLHNDDTGATLNGTTNSTGAYNFALLPPGHYTITATATNYQKTTAGADATVGQVTQANLKLQLSTASQTVTVTAEGGVLQTVSPNLSTTMSTEQIQLVPNGGGDLSYIAQTAPGSTMNTEGGYGNFSSNGLPAITNNFTVNSMPENDPFLNLNNSGATNILLGQNDVGEATVVSNGYSGEYSQAGANVNYVSRSGTNQWHGNAIWRWNGRDVNANNYFLNQSGAPRPFVNDNQWAASIGGPIRKNKTFFFVNTEGLYLIVPVTRNVKVPSPQFQSAVLANITTAQPGELSLYQSMFNIYNQAPGVSTATPVTNGGCGTFTALGGFGGAGGMPCALQYNSGVNVGTHEWLITGRLDQNFGNNDRAFVHFRMDRGNQATYTDPLSPMLNASSYQPQYEGQLQEVHTFSPNTVNSFNLNGSYYRAIFGYPDQAATLAFQPLEMAFAGGAFYSLGRDYSIFPQGRNVTQYGFVEDLSHTMGNHALKVGANLARFDVTTFGSGVGTIPSISGETLDAFYAGIASPGSFTQAFPSRLEEPINLYNLGLYAEDTWHVKSGLSLTLTFRADRNSNPSCVTDCFNRFTNNFQNLNADVTTPYNQSIVSGISNALPSSYHPWTWEPRFGFNWTPFGADPGIVLSGGFGLFGTTLPAGFVDSLVTNLPGDPSFSIGGLPFAPGIAGNVQSAAAAAANALRAGFANNATWADLNAAVMGATGGTTGFSVPNFFNAGQGYHTPRFQEWDLQLQKSIGNNMSLQLKYVGNHGIWEQVNNTGLNAYCGTATPITAGAGATPCLSTATVPGALPFTTFNGLPTAPMDPRFNIVTQFSSGYNSNYNGFTASFVRRFAALQLQFNYTWSHALDYVSNAGQGDEPFTDNTNLSITNPQNPFNVYQNMYGNADYDVRHYFSASYVYSTPKHAFGGFLGKLAGDWTIAGTVFAHTGLPFTVVDNVTGPTLAAYGYGGASLAGSTFADQTGGYGSPVVCGSQYAEATTTGCAAMLNNFAADTTGFGSQRRNQVYGPNFFDTDLTISKDLPIPHWESGHLTIGATAYNLFNHPNFDQPVGDVTNGSFGFIQSTVNPPTSIYGAFLGADSSPRTLQSQIKLVW